MTPYEEAFIDYVRGEARKYANGDIPIVTITAPEPWGATSVYTYEKPLGLRNHEWELLQLAMLHDVATYYDHLEARAAATLINVAKSEYVG